MNNSATLNEAITILKSRNIRITPQREIILSYLINTDTHPSVEMIRDAISDKLPNLSVATIYNTLKLLVDNELVIELPNDDGGIRYDYFGTPHFHTICTNCGKITDVYDQQFGQIAAQIRELTATNSGYQNLKVHVEVSGLCPECQLKLKH